MLRIIQTTIILTIATLLASCLGTGQKNKDMENLRAKLNEYISRQDATIGIAVISRDGDTLTINDSQEYPMMSVRLDASLLI